MMAACTAAAHGASVLVLEKNEKAGKKIYITGKGRCNFTNACDTEDFFAHVARNSSFLYSSVYGFDSHDVMDWFEQRGVRTKVERGMRAFPLSDHASDITRCLEKEMERLGVVTRFGTEVKELLFSEETQQGKELSPEVQQGNDLAPEAQRKDARPAESNGCRSVSGVRLRDHTEYYAREVIVAEVIASTFPPSFFTASGDVASMPENCFMKPSLVRFAPRPGVSAASSLRYATTL